MSLMESGGQSREISQEIAPVNLRLIMSDPGKNNERKARVEYEAEQLARLVESDSDKQVAVDGSQLYQLIQEAGYERVEASKPIAKTEVQSVDLRIARIDPGDAPDRIERQDWQIEMIRQADRGRAKVIVDSCELYVALNKAQYVPNIPIDWSTLEQRASKSRKMAQSILGPLARLLRALPERD